MKENIKFNLKLEQYKLEELSESSIESIKLNSDEKEYLDYIEEDNKDFFEKFDISNLAMNTKSKLDNKKIIKFPIKTITALVSVAACLILTLNILPLVNNNNPEIIYLKGSENLNIYLKTKDSISKLKNLDIIDDKSQLQLTYRSNNRYGVIFSVDGLNNITYHYPEQFNQITNLELGKEITLPTSYTLDNAPFFEKFYFISTDSSLDIKYLRDSISNIKVSGGRIVKELDLTKKYKITDITLLKE